MPIPFAEGEPRPNPSFWEAKVLDGAMVRSDVTCCVLLYRELVFVKLLYGVRKGGSRSIIRAPDLRIFSSPPVHIRSEEHTSELQSRENLVCRLLLEKKKNL